MPANAAILDVARLANVSRQTVTRALIVDLRLDL
jgi:hypothetical protein